MQPTYPDPARLHLAGDPVMARLMGETPEPKVVADYADNVYLSLLESIVSQQISVKAADAILLMG